MSEKTPADFTSRVFSLESYNAFLESHPWASSQIEDICHMTPMQEGMLFHALLEPQSRAYFIQSSWLAEGPLRVEFVRESWNRISDRYAIFRTAFVHDGLRRPIQIVLRSRPPEFCVHDLGGLSEQNQNRRGAELRQQDINRGFDLQKDVLLRISVTRFSETRNRITVSYPHLLLDGWCLRLVYRELQTTYAALVQGREPPPSAVIPFSDYVRWLDRQNPEAAREYWRSYLDGYDTVASVPRLSGERSASADLPREHSVRIDLSTTARLNQLAQGHGVTLNTIIQCVWSVLLARFNDTPDIVFGAVVSGRPSELRGVEDMVGLFINCVPVRIQFDKGLSVSALLEIVQNSFLSGQPYHHLPLAEIQNQSPLGRELFDHVLVFENYPSEGSGPSHATGAAELRIEVAEAHDRTHYDLDVTVVPGNTIDIRIGYNARVFSDDQVSRMTEHIQQIVNQILNTPNQLVDDIELLSDAELRKLTCTSEASDNSTYPEGTWLEIFDRWVAQTPAAVAASFDGESLTYGELALQADRLAHRLQLLGVGPEVRVGLHLERSLQMTVATLATFRAGGAYVPLDPLYPRERIEYMLRDSNVSVLVTQRALLSRTELPSHVQVLCCDDAADDSAAPLAVGFPRADAANMAYLIYTSGSTGRPKGVVVEHRSLLNLAYAWRQFYALDSFEVRVLQMASLSFDVFPGDLIRALTNGGSLVVCPAETTADPTALHRLLLEHRISVLESTPALILPLMDYVHANALDVSFLRLLICGSDTLKWDDYRTLVERFGDRLRIINGYGVTEAGIASSEFESEAGTGHHGLATPIGKPLRNVQCIVRDRLGHLCPVGIPGRLFIGGPGVARGYHGSPARTAERFIPNPDGSGERMYDTGDIARWLPDGNLEFLGRDDDQVKVRGCRVDLGEIEHHLRQRPDVADAVVIPVGLMEEQGTLVAYVVPRGAGHRGDEPDENWARNLRRTLREELPEYMTPSHFVRLPSLPLSPNGKLDKRALPVPATAKRLSGECPFSPLEQEIRDIWRDVLQVEGLGIHDNFFDLGGHSLKAMQIVSLVGRQCDAKISLSEFLNSPTIAACAALVRRADARGSPDAIPTALPADSYPLSHAQQRLWFVHRMGAGTAYNMPDVYVLEGAVNCSALNAAFQTLIARHEALRTAFVEENGEPRQRIRGETPFAVQELDLRHTDDPESAAQHIAEAEARYLFDLAHPPLSRATLARIGERRYVFILVIHHIVGDGWSGIVLYRELMRLYHASCAGLPHNLKPLRIQPKDFAVWQTTKNFDADERYWVARLAGMPELVRLAYDFPVHEERDFRGGIQRHVWPAELVAQLRSVCMAKNTTLSNVVLAVFQLLLYQMTGQNDIGVGMSIANRNHPDLENLIGFFVNILPIRTRFSADMDIDDLLNQITPSVYEAFEHQDYPFDLLVRKLSPGRYGNRQPIVNVIYAFQNFTDVNVNVGGNGLTADFDGGQSNSPPITVSPLDLSATTSKFDLTLFVEDQGDTLEMTFEFDTALFLPASITRMHARFEYFAKLLALEINSETTVNET